MREITNVAHKLNEFRLVNDIKKYLYDIGERFVKKNKI